MSTSPRTLGRSSVVAALVLTVGGRAHAQVLRERDVGTIDGAMFGTACARLGDVDGDGIDDFIVGWRYFDDGSLLFPGRVVIYSGATGAVVRTHDGGDFGGQFGCSVACAGDVDGDGVTDYVVGEESESSVYRYEGKAVVYSGQSGSMIWTKVGTIDGGFLGHVVAGIGDVDGDGRSEVILGSNSNGNEVFVVDAYGNTLYHMTGNGSDGFGMSVSGCGDLDGDGVNDFLVGAPFADWWASKTQQLIAAGDVIAYSGATGLFIRSNYGNNSFDYFGDSLAALGDVDGDGVRDYVGGDYISFNYGGSGYVRVISGATGSTIRTQTGATGHDLFAYSICGTGDVDRDGVPDYAVGAIDAGAANEGAVTVFSGSSGALIHEVTGLSGASSNFGSCVASGDWNGDGVPDLICGDYDFHDTANGTYPGAVDVVLMCPAWWQNYGAGWTGKNGIPSLTAAENPVVGSPLDLVLGNSLGANTTALLFVGLQSANIPIHNSGTLWVAPLLSIVLPVPAAGFTLNGALPNDPNLDFLDLYLQALELDPFASKGLSFTPGLQLHCGFDLP